MRDHGDSPLQAVKLSIVDLCRAYRTILTSEHCFVNSMNVSIRWIARLFQLRFANEYAYVSYTQQMHCACLQSLNHDSTCNLMHIYWQTVGLVVAVVV